MNLKKTDYFVRLWWTDGDYEWSFLEGKLAKKALVGLSAWYFHLVAREGCSWQNLMALSFQSCEAFSFTRHVPTFRQFHGLSFFLFASCLAHSFLLKQDYSTFFCTHSHDHHHGDHCSTPNKWVWFKVQDQAKNHSPSQVTPIFDALVVFQDDFWVLLSIQDLTHLTHLVIMDI